MSLETINLICIIWIIIAITSFVLLQYVTAPYGRHVKKGWGPEIANHLGWVIMELPSFLIILYFTTAYSQSSYALLLSLLWLFHYFNRTFIFPFRIKTKNKKMPLTIVGSAIFFNTINAGLNGYYLSHLENYTIENFNSWYFYLGIAFFIIGFIINQISDTLLINLRKPNEVGYKIPKGFLFSYISCPNLFGEIIQWTGFAIMAWNIPAVTFLIWTLANLVPRAAGHHKWYREHFSEYPKNRKALIPGIW